MTRTTVNERHAHQERVNQLVRQLAELGEGSALHLELLNVVNEAYAQGYRDGDPENRGYLATPDGTEVIMDGAGRVIGQIPPPIVIHGTVSGRFWTYLHADGHVHVWDTERNETIAMFEKPDRVAFNINRVDGTPQGEGNEDQQLRQVAEEVRARWAASRAVPPPHYIVCLPHDFVDKLKARTEDLTDDHGVATGIRDALMLFVDQLDAWTEWDARQGWR